MKTIATALRRLIGWLAEPEPRSGPAPSLSDWADLPVHHPRRD